MVNLYQVTIKKCGPIATPFVVWLKRGETTEQLGAFETIKEAAKHRTYATLMIQKQIREFEQRTAEKS